LAIAAHERGVRIAPGARFGIGGAFERFVRLPYALPEPILSEVVERLTDAWSEVSQAGRARIETNRRSLTEAI